MRYRNSGSEIVVRFDEGEDIVSLLKQICRKEMINAAMISGLGACRKAEIAHYNPKTKKYKLKKLSGPLEIVSLVGNIAMLKGEPTAHLHICFSMHDFSVVGGHLMKTEVHPTCEMVILPLKKKIDRKFDRKTGLNLQRF